MSPVRHASGMSQAHIRHPLWLRQKVPKPTTTATATATVTGVFSQPQTRSLCPAGHRQATHMNSHAEYTHRYTLTHTHSHSHSHIHTATVSTRSGRRGKRSASQSAASPSTSARNPGGLRLHSPIASRIAPMTRWMLMDGRNSRARPVSLHFTIDTFFLC